MSKHYVELSEPINNNHWRYENFIREFEFTKDGKTSTTRYMSLGHGFTHIDAPRHMSKDGKVLEDFDLFNFLIGHASILDVSDIKPCEGITKEHLVKAFEGCKYTDFLIVKTSWGLQRNSSTKEFWSEAPYMTEEGTEYLRSLNPKVVGFDFPQDYGIRSGGKEPITRENSPTHFIILLNDILMIEYMTNLWEVSEKNVEIFAMPLNIKIENNDCAQIRIVARC